MAPPVLVRADRRPGRSLADARRPAGRLRRADQAADRRDGPGHRRRRLPARRPAAASHPSTLLLTLLGTGLVAGGASALEPVPGAGPRRPDAADGRTDPCRAAGSPRPRRRSSASLLGLVGLALLGARRQPGSPRPWRWRHSSSTSFVYTPAEADDDPEHGHRRGAGRLAAGHRLGGGDGTAGHRGLGAVPDRLPLAVPALPGDRLDLPRRLRPGRATRCCPTSTRRGR